MTPAELVAELYEARIEQGLSISEVARRAGGISNGHLSEVERGLGEPSIGRFVAWADALGLEVIVQPRRRR